MRDAAYDVIIVGAGLAGLSCAMELIECGMRVLVLEANPYVGGRTASWTEDGMEVESGLHRFLGFYEALPALMKKSGIQLSSALSWINEIEIRMPDQGPTASFAISPLGKPIQSLWDMLSNNHFLSPLDKLTLTKFLITGLVEYKTRPEKLDTYTVTEFAKKHHVNDRIVQRVLIPLTAGLFFLPPERYSAYVFFGTIGPYLSRVQKLGEAAFAGGMTTVMTGPIADAVVDRGAELEVGQRVTGLVRTETLVSGVKVGKEMIMSRHVVLAVDIGSAQRLLKKEFPTYAEFQPFFSLGTLPAVTVQVELDHPSLPTDKVTFSPDTHLASYAEQSRTTFAAQPGRLSLILTPPEKFLYMDPETIFEYVKKDAARVGIDLKGVKRYRIISHPHDFYALTPNTDALRPTQQTSLAGLTLAGDYTKQEFLATMEGAVVSGQLAAEAVLRELI